MKSGGLARLRSSSGRLQRAMPGKNFAQRLQWSQREDRFQWQIEELADPDGQLEAGGVIPALDETHRLVVDVQSSRQLLAGQATVRTENGQPVVDARRGLCRVALTAWHHPKKVLSISNNLSRRESYCSVPRTMSQ